MGFELSIPLKAKRKFVYENIYPRSCPIVYRLRYWSENRSRDVRAMSEVLERIKKAAQREKERREKQRLKNLWNYDAHAAAEKRKPQEN